MIYEDELPEDMSENDYALWFDSSFVDGVRIGPGIRRSDKTTENFIQNRFGYCFYEVRGYALIYNLFVHPEFRRQGHAGKLLRFVINEIRELGHAGEIRIKAAPREGVPVGSLSRFYAAMCLKVVDE